VAAYRRRDAIAKARQGAADKLIETIVLVSREIRKALPDGFQLVKGKHEAQEVYQLASDLRT